jgi:phage shock protein A
MSIYSDLKEALLLIDSVKDLKGSVEKLADVVADLDRRLIRLEERIDGHAENVKVAAVSAASISAQSAVFSLHERIGAVERRLEQTERKLPKPD